MADAQQNIKQVKKKKDIGYLQKNFQYPGFQTQYKNMLCKQQYNRIDKCEKCWQIAEKKKNKETVRKILGLRDEKKKNKHLHFAENKMMEYIQAEVLQSKYLLE